MAFEPCWTQEELAALQLHSICSWMSHTLAAAVALPSTCCRYGLSEERLPELHQTAVDAACPLVAADPDEGTEEVEALEATPTILALVDACWEEEGALDAVKSALAAAVEALPPAGRFGLLTFGSQVWYFAPCDA